MTDLSKTIAPKSDQLNADDLITGPRTITVTKVVGNESNDQPISIFFDGDDGKPYKPGLSMRRALVKVWGEEGDNYVGRSMTLYCDPEVKFGGVKLGGIRISHMSDIENSVSMMLTTTRSKRKEFTVKPLASTPGGALIQAAEDAADKGTEAFKDFWNSDDGKKGRAKLKPHMDKLKARAEAADRALKTTQQRLLEAAEKKFEEERQQELLKEE